MALWRSFRAERSRLRTGIATTAALAVGVVVKQAISSSPTFATQFCNT